jgi:hypothetical protein
MEDKHKQMHYICQKMRKWIWILFLLVVAGLASWFIATSGLAICSYFSYSVQVPASIKSWSVEEKKSDQFEVLAYYSYQYKNKEYGGTSRVGNFYPNPWAANLAKNHYAKQPWKAWIKPKDPGKSLLEKRFPYKKAVSAAILVALVIYFVSLGAYVRLKHGR